MTIAYYSDLDLDTLAQPYQGRLIENPVVRRRLSDLFFGTIEVQDASLTLANADGALTTPYVNDLRGRSLVLKKHDAVSGQTWTRWTGLVGQAELQRGQLALTGQNFDLAALKTLVPVGLVDTATHPLAVDVGLPYPVAIGSCAKVRCVYVKRDLTNNQYDYIVSRGAVTVPAVYRIGSGETVFGVNPSEYTVSTVVYPDPIGTCTQIRFTREQLDFSNQQMPIHADVTGLVAERNPVEFLRTLLSSTTWGLGASVVAASFNLGAAQVDAFGGLFVDAALTEQREAREWIRYALMMRGMRLSVSSALAWQIDVDNPSKILRLTAQDGPGDGERTLISVRGLTRPPIEEMISDVVIRYRWDHLRNRLLFEQRRQASTMGEERVFENPLVSSHETADRMAYYMATRFRITQQRLTVTLGQEARQLSERELVSVTDPALGLSARLMEVAEIGDDLYEPEATLVDYDPVIYGYIPAVLNADDTLGTQSDLSQVTPNDVTGLAITSSNVEISTSGDLLSYVVLAFTTPAVAYGAARIDVKKSADGVYHTGWASTTASGAVSVKVAGLIPGTAYDFRVVVISPFGRPSAGTTISATALSDPGSGLPTPTLSVHKGTGKSIEGDVSVTPPATWGYIEIARNTSNTVVGATTISKHKSLRFTDLNIAYTTMYYYFGRVVDTKGNVGSWSSSASLSVSPLVQGDLSSSSVGTTQMQGSSVTTSKRQVLSTLSVGYSVGAQTYTTTAAQSHNLGTSPNVTLDSGQGAVIAGMHSISSTQFILTLYNASIGALSGTATAYFW